MKSKYFSIFIFCILVTTLLAQDKLFTLEDVILRGRTKLSPKNLTQLQWITNTNSFSYVDSINTGKGLIRGHADDKDIEMLLTLDSLSTIVGKKIKRFPRIEWVDKNIFNFWVDEKLYAFDIDKGSIKLINQIEAEAENKDLEDQKNYVAYTINNNLYIALNSQLQKQVTFDEDDGIVNGQTVHRVEFGIRKGTFWSPKSNYLAFYHKDERAVSEYPLVNVETTPAELFTTRYPMAGQPSEHVQIGVYNLKTASTTFLQTGEPKDQYLTSVVWSPDEKNIYVGHLNRDQNHLRMVQYDVPTGKPVKTLFEESHPKYINPQQGIIFTDDNPDKFLWLSRRDGYNHLYYYNTNGKLIRQLTTGDWEITSFKGIDSKGQYAFFIGASSDAMERHGCRVKLSSGKVEKLTALNGQHDIFPNKDGILFLDRFSNLDTPRLISIINEKGTTTKILLESENPVGDFKLGETKISKIINDGVQLNTRTIFPVDFDPEKKYPVIVYLYGGPSAQQVHNRWLGGGRLWYHYLAQNGYFLFTIDNRGSANRGREFEQATFRRLGTIEVKDQKAGLDYLKSLDYIDTTRIGVFGWSYGGFMSLSVMTRLPDEFKAAVSGAPVTDWKFYEVMYGERYMDTPESNPDGYDESSTLNYIQNLEGNLLIIHGTVDPTVVWQNSLAYINQAVKLGKQVDYAIYPGHKHGIGGKDRLHLYQKITDYFNEHLQNE